MALIKDFLAGIDARWNCRGNDAGLRAEGPTKIPLAVDAASNPRPASIEAVIAYSIRPGSVTARFA